MEESILNPLDFHPRFSHITEQILEQLDNKSLTNCREVAKYWQKVIDDRKLSWIRIVNFPIIPRIGCYYGSDPGGTTNIAQYMTGTFVSMKLLRLFAKF